MVADRPPDLILLDVMMPRMDGNEVAKRIKADKSLPFIPIIMQTALDTTQSKVTGLDAGADDYVTKPINYDELQARMNSALRLKKAQDELAAKNARACQEMSRSPMRSPACSTAGISTCCSTRCSSTRVRLHEYLALAMFDIDHFKRVNDTLRPSGRRRRARPVLATPQASRAGH